MEINLTETKKQIILVFLLMILPILVIIAGLVYNVLNAWYFISAVTWFGVGLIFYCAIE